MMDSLVRLSPYVFFVMFVFSLGGVAMAGFLGLISGRVLRIEGRFACVVIVTLWFAVYGWWPFYKTVFSEERIPLGEFFLNEYGRLRFDVIGQYPACLFLTGICIGLYGRRGVVYFGIWCGRFMRIFNDVMKDKSLPVDRIGVCWVAAKAGIKADCFFLGLSHVAFLPESAGEDRETALAEISSKMDFESSGVRILRRLFFLVVFLVSVYLLAETPSWTLQRRF